jgi:hypothetical protein
MATFEGNINKWPMFVMKFKTMLEYKELGHIIERDSDPAVPGESTEERAHREALSKTRTKDDARVRGFLINKLSEATLTLVEDCTTAYEMMQRLESQYRSTSAASVISRLDKLLDIKYKPGEEISLHVGEINSLIYQIKKAGGLDLEKLHIVMLLKSMPKNDDWNVVVTNLKSMDEATLTKERIVKSLTERADELRSTGTVTHQRRTPNTAFAADEVDKSNVKCYGCGKMGHYKSECYRNQPAKHAGKSYRPGGRPHSTQKHGGNAHVATTATGDKSGNANGAFAFAATPRNDAGQDHAWIKDSGAGKWYTWDKSILHDYKPISAESCEGITGNATAVKGVGKGYFKSTLSDGSVVDLEWNEIYWAPAFKCNLMSTVVTDGKGIHSVEQNGVTRFTFKGEEIMSAHSVDGRWVMNLEPIRTSESHQALIAGPGHQNDLWHQRFCHLSYDALVKTAPHVDGMTIKANTEVTHLCNGCMEGKMQQRPFKTSKGPRA